MVRVVFFIFCSGFLLSAFRIMPVMDKREDSRRDIYGESTPRQSPYSGGELYTEAAGIYASTSAWPRRDRIKPEKPFAAKVLADTAFIKLSWAPNHEADLKGYRVYRSSEDNPLKFKLITKKSISSASFTEKHPGSTGKRFVYRISAIDRAGNESEYVSLEVIVPDKLKPSAPRLEDVSYRKGLVYIRWKANSEKDIMGYWIFRQKDSLLDTLPLNKTLLPASAVLYLDRSAESNSIYTYFLLAVDSTGLRSERSRMIQVNTLAGETLGEVITGLKAGYDSLRKSVTLSFRCAADTHSIQGFVILRSSDHSHYYPISSLLKTPVFSDTSLEKGAAYSYKVNVVTSEGRTIEGRTIVRVRAD